MTIRGTTAIVGGATFGSGEMPGWEAVELAAAASQAAVADAGLALSDVDAVFVALPQDFFSGLSFSEQLGIRPRLTDNNRTGGSAFLTHTQFAALALQAKLCDVALIAYGSNQRTQSGKLVTSLRPSRFESPFKPLMPPTAYALAAARHLHQYGTTSSQLAAVAVAARQWANLNPEAFAQGPLTIDDCLSSRMISNPLRARDCCLITDGAAAIVMTRADRARHLRQDPVYLLGAAAETHHYEIAQMADMTTTAAVESGRRAMEEAGVTHTDVDVVELYDAFTINTILFLEDLGFCPKGEGGKFVEDGRIAPGGELPVNTNGGGLSCTHPGMYGLFLLVEAVRQLRGQAGKRQVGAAEVALCHASGGVLSSQATNILGTAVTI